METFRKNKTFVVLAMAFASSLCLSCGDKKPTGDIITRRPVETVKKTTQKMGDYEQNQRVSWLGSSYSVYVERKADPSLQVVSDGDGNKYYDNRITVVIERKDGTVFFKKTFTTSDFGEYIDDSYSHDGALLGVVYNKVEGDFICFAASVGSPDKMSDEYIPLVVKISRTGNVSISRDTNLDTEDETTPDEE